MNIHISTAVMSETNVIEERIYLGNVDFTATEDELKDFFGSSNVTAVEIPSKTITRGKKTFVKRLGFAFVLFSSKEEADRAIEEYNGKEFKSRHIHAKKAVPPVTGEEKKKKTEAYFAKQKELRAKADKKKKDDTKAKAKAETTADEGKVSAEDQDGGKSTAEGKLTGANGTKPSKAANGAASPKPSKESSAKKTQDASKTPAGSKSKDTVFITNLDYKTNIKALNSLFKELKPKWVHIPPRRMPYHVLKRYQAQQRPIFNKGIAFAKFPSEEVQLKAIEQFNGHEVDGRKIIVEVAVDRVVPEGVTEHTPDAAEEAEGEASESKTVPEAAEDADSTAAKVEGQDS